jgi:hypothetical protein
MDVRFAAAASLIAFGSMIVVGALVLVPPEVERRLVARAEISSPRANPCPGQIGLHFERNCLAEETPRDDTIAGQEPFKAAPVEIASPSENAPQQPLTRNKYAAAVPQESAPLTDTTTPERNAPVEPFTEDLHGGTSPQVAARQTNFTALERRTPGPLRARERQSAKPVIQAHTRLPVVRKPIPREQAKERSKKNEALRVVRRFGDTLQDIPVSAYAADGKQRTIIIRPTSIQDVYYYSGR